MIRNPNTPKHKWNTALVRHNCTIYNTKNTYDQFKLLSGCLQTAISCYGKLYTEEWVLRYVMLYHMETGNWNFNGSQWFHLEGSSSSGPFHHSPHDTVSHLWSLKSSAVPLLQAQILQLHSQFLHDSHIKLTHFPCSPASSINLLNSSLRSLILFLFSLRSSSARSFTYFSNTCFLSLDVSSRYLGSNTILCSSFSHVLNAETYNIQYRKCYTLTSTVNSKSACKVHPRTDHKGPEK